MAFFLFIPFILLACMIWYLQKSQDWTSPVSCTQAAWLTLALGLKSCFQLMMHDRHKPARYSQSYVLSLRAMLFCTMSGVTACYTPTSRCDDSIHIPQTGTGTGRRRPLQITSWSQGSVCLLGSDQVFQRPERLCSHTCTRPVRWKQMSCLVGGNTVVCIPHQSASTTGNWSWGEPHPKWTR